MQGVIQNFLIAHHSSNLCGMEGVLSSLGESPKDR